MVVEEATDQGEGCCGRIGTEDVGFVLLCYY